MDSRVLYTWQSFTNGLTFYSHVTNFHKLTYILYSRDKLPQMDLDAKVTWQTSTNGFTCVWPRDLDLNCEWPCDVLEKMFLVFLTGRKYKMTLCLLWWRGLCFRVFRSFDLMATDKCWHWRAQVMMLMGERRSETRLFLPLMKLIIDKPLLLFFSSFFVIWFVFLHFFFVGWIIGNDWLFLFWVKNLIKCWEVLAEALFF